jgi:anti-anti-sigma factor
MGLTAARRQPERAPMKPSPSLRFGIGAHCGLYEETVRPGMARAAYGGGVARARGSSSPPPPLVAALGGGERVEPVVLFAGHFRVAVVECGSTSHLSLSGEFDIAGVGRVEDALDGVFRPPRPRQVLFDLRGLTFLDAAGLRTILRANERARTTAVELRVVRPRGPANRVFTLTRAGAELRMVDDPAGMA